MLNRSIDRDFDISYHRRAIEKCLEDIREHVLALKAVGYEPYQEMDDAEDQCAILKEECSAALY